MFPHQAAYTYTLLARVLQWEPLAVQRDQIVYPTQRPLARKFPLPAVG